MFLPKTQSITRFSTQLFSSFPNSSLIFDIFGLQIRAKFTQIMAQIKDIFVWIQVLSVIG